MQYITASRAEAELCVRLRLETLRAVNGLPAEYAFKEEFVAASRAYFEQADQTTILALDEAGRGAGCATLCYLSLMPTFDHPTGRRAHLMNVYTRSDCRRRGVACQMVELLIGQARQRGVTEISLDATDEGRPLYEKCGFAPSEEGMVLVLG